MNSHKNTLSNILQNPSTNVVRSLVYVCKCVYVCGSVYLRTYPCAWYMYMPIMAVKTMYIISRIHAHTGATYRVSICIRYRLCDSRMKASFLINTRNYRKRSKSIFRRFYFLFFFLSLSPFARHVYKISITIKS